MRHGSYQRTMATHRAACAADASEARRLRLAATRTTRCAQQHLVSFANRSSLERLAREVSPVPNLPSMVPTVDPTWRFCPHSRPIGRRFGATWHGKQDHDDRRPPWYSSRRLRGPRFSARGNAGRRAPRCRGNTISASSTHGRQSI